MDRTRGAKNLHPHIRGAALSEYGLLAGLIAAIAISSVLALGRSIRFDYLVGALEGYSITHKLSNYLANGDFDNVSGMSPTAWGYRSYSVAGWSEISGSNLPFELHKDGWQGMHSINGGYWLDTNASPGHLTIAQTLHNLKKDNVYKITLYAGDRDPDLDGSADVYWNGVFKGTVKLDTEDKMKAFSYYIESGEGNGQDTVTIIDTGSNDSNGISLDKVRIYGPE